MGEPMFERLEPESKDALSESGGLVQTGHSRAVAEYLADMIEQLESMARVGGLDLLSYLLSMARLEAETNARTLVDDSRPASRGS